MFQAILKFTPIAILAMCCMPTTATSLIKNRIVGGESIDIGKAAHLVSIRYKKKNTTPFEHRCAGIIYSSKVILTTATCLIGLPSNRLHVKAGSPYLSQIDGYLYLVENYIIHSEYNIWFRDNDLALLLLAFDLTVNDPEEIAPIALTSSAPPVGSLATIAGWGHTNSRANSNFSEVLQIANANIIDDSVCKRSYGENRISPAMLCAAGKNADACLGDAGGALVQEGKAVGLISRGYGCTDLNFTGVYTNLVYLKQWIENEVAKL